MSKLLENSHILSFNMSKCLSIQDKCNIIRKLMDFVRKMTQLHVWKLNSLSTILKKLNIKTQYKLMVNGSGSRKCLRALE